MQRDTGPGDDIASHMNKKPLQPSIVKKMRVSDKQGVVIKSQSQMLASKEKTIAEKRLLKNFTTTNNMAGGKLSRQVTTGNGTTFKLKIK